MARLIDAMLRVRSMPAVAAILLLVTACAVALYSGAAGSATSKGPTGLPECPQDSIRLVVHPDHGVTAVVTTIAIAHHIANVPEFNDCQAFVGPSGVQYLTDVAGPALFAIFASETLDSLDQRLTEQHERNDSAGSPDPVALSAAEIYSFGAAYRPLGIKRDFNCLLLRRSFVNGNAIWHAVMVAVGSDEPKCGSKFGPLAPGETVTPLEVRVMPNPAGMSSSDVPAVARWDWDRERKEQYIGIKCGGNWCEVGRFGFVSSPSYTVSDPSPAFRRTRMVKGWYDEQFLAFQPKGAPAHLSVLLGTLYPSADLDRWAEPPTTSPYAGHFVTAAYVELHPTLLTGSAAVASYDLKFNFAVTPAGTPLNEIKLCNGSDVECFNGIRPPPSTLVSPCLQAAADAGVGPPWWAQVIRGGAAPGNITYKCVKRRTHGTNVPHIPGAARWRWMVEDEGTWMRCLQGCCEKN